MSCLRAGVRVVCVIYFFLFIYCYFCCFPPPSLSRLTHCRSETVFYLCSQIYAISKMNILIVFIVALRGRGRVGRGLMVAAVDVRRRWQPRLRCSASSSSSCSSYSGCSSCSGCCDPAAVTRVSNHKICMCAHMFGCGTF